MINIDDLLDLDIDEISRLLDGDIDSITEIFLEGNDLASNLQTNRENDKMLLKETAILSESLAGKSIGKWTQLLQLTVNSLLTLTGK